MHVSSVAKNMCASMPHTVHLTDVVLAGVTAIMHECLPGRKAVIQGLQPTYGRPRAASACLELGWGMHVFQSKWDTIVENHCHALRVVCSTHTVHCTCMAG